MDHICGRRLAREKRAALCPAVRTQPHPSADLGGAILRTSGRPTEPDSREIGSLWIPRRGKVGTIVPLVYPRMERGTRPIVAVLPKTKAEQNLECSTIDCRSRLKTKRNFYEQRTEVHVAAAWWNLESGVVTGSTPGANRKIHELDRFVTEEKPLPWG